MYSMNAVNWTACLNSFTNSVWAVTYNPSQGLWGGTGKAQPVIYSTNGYNWTATPGLTLSGNPNGSNIMTNTTQNIWLVNNGGTTMGYSPNIGSSNWTLVGATTGITTFTAMVYSYVYGIWIVGGAPNTANAVAYSTDAITWTATLVSGAFGGPGTLASMG
jgi:hypothetical protein